MEHSIIEEFRVICMKYTDIYFFANHAHSPRNGLVIIMKDRRVICDKCKVNFESHGAYFTNNSFKSSSCQYTMHKNSDLCLIRIIDFFAENNIQSKICPYMPDAYEDGLVWRSVRHNADVSEYISVEVMKKIVFTENILRCPQLYALYLLYADEDITEDQCTVMYNTYKEAPVRRCKGLIKRVFLDYHQVFINRFSKRHLFNMAELLIQIMIQNDGVYRFSPDEILRAKEIMATSKKDYLAKMSPLVEHDLIGPIADIVCGYLK